MANRISLDGVTYDISNLLLKSNVAAADQKIYPTHLLSENDDEIVLNESHYHRNSAAKETCLCATESLGLDNVFNKSTHRENHPERWPSHSMHGSQTSTRANEQARRRSHEVVDPRQRGVERPALLSYRPDDDDDDSVCAHDPVRNRLPSPVASPKGRLNTSSHQRDAWGQRSPLKTPYNDIDNVTAKAIGAQGASNEKLAELLHQNYKDNNDSDTSMGVESLMIEIMPGLSEPLRGSAETMKAHMSGNIMRIHCVCCDQDISCVGDAAYVLCPTCTVVSPAPSESMNGNSSWGVGLGFLADQFHVDDSMLSRSSSLAESSYSRNY